APPQIVKPPYLSSIHSRLTIGPTKAVKIAALDHAGYTAGRWRPVCATGGRAPCTEVLGFCDVAEAHPAGRGRARYSLPDGPYPDRCGLCGRCRGRRLPDYRSSYKPLRGIFPLVPSSMPL